LSHGGEQHSRRNLLTKLSDHFGPDFLLLNGNDVANLLVFHSITAGLLRLVSKGDDDIDISLEKLASRIVSESKQLVPDQHTYHAGIDLDMALECVRFGCCNPHFSIVLEH